MKMRNSRDRYLGTDEGMDGVHYAAIVAETLSEVR